MIRHLKGEAMIKVFLIVSVIYATLFAASPKITPNEVYGQVELIRKHVHFLLEHYGVKHNDKKINSEVSQITTQMRPRNVWQKSYEVLVKINIMRKQHNLPIVEPVNMAPVLNLNPDLVYEQTQRVLTELKIFEFRNGIKPPYFQVNKYNSKVPLDVFKGFSAVSLALDILNRSSFTPSYVFGENMRVFDDISRIIQKLGIEDDTIPPEKNEQATPKDTFSVGLKTLEKIKLLQILAGIKYVDFSTYKKEFPTPSDVFSITQMIIAELQTLKAYLGINYVTPSAKRYYGKTPAEVHQLMRWNLRKLSLIKTITVQRGY